MNEIVIRIEGLEELTKAVQALAAGSGAGAAATAPVITATEQVQPVPQQAPVSQIPTQQVPVQQTPVQQPPIQQWNAAGTVPTAPTAQPVTQVPTTAAPQQYSFDQLAVALSNLCVNMNKQTEVHNLLNQFGVNALFDLPKERYGEFATAMRGIGGVI
ncbi:MAG: hypothetical protein ACI4HQ_10215 [Acetatifactor sp.]